MEIFRFAMAFPIDSEGWNWWNFKSLGMVEIESEKGENHTWGLVSSG